MKCHNCKKKNTEFIYFKFWIFRVRVCQKCISKAFRGFKRGK